MTLGSAESDAAEMRRPAAPTVSLRAAAATIFALLTVLPLLVVVFVLSRVEPLPKIEAQVTLLLAVLIPLFGFRVFRQMLGQISRLAQELEEPALFAAPVAEVAAAPVPGLGRLAELAQVGEAFRRLLDDLRASTDRLEDLAFKLGTLNETVELAARIPDLQGLAELVQERTMRAVGAEIGSVMLLDAERQTLRIAAARGLPDEVVAGAELRLGEGIAGKVAQLGELVLVNDIETDPRFAQANDPKYGSGAFISLPIRVGARVIGVLNLAKKEAAWGRAPRFSSTDLHFLNPLMMYVGYALDNARLLEETRQSAAGLEQALHDLRATQAALVRSETLRATGELAAGLAHHLKNLLAVVSGRIGMALAAVQEPQVRRSLETAERTTREAAEVIHRLGRFAGAEPASEFMPVDLNQLVEEVVDLARPRWQYEAPRRGGAIEVSLELGGIPPVQGEPAALREALLNLLFNALDALPEGGRIGVRTWAAGGRVFCAVADSGVGMSEEVRHRAVEPFFTTKGAAGTGLGLSVAYAVIQRHGGDLLIESAPGHGTTATMNLPAAPEGAQREP